MVNHAATRTDFGIPETIESGLQGRKAGKSRTTAIRAPIDVDRPAKVESPRAFSSGALRNASPFAMTAALPAAATAAIPIGTLKSK